MNIGNNFEGDWRLPEGEAEQMITKEMEEAKKTLKAGIDELERLSEEIRDLNEKVIGSLQRMQEIQGEITGLGDKWEKMKERDEDIPEKKNQEIVEKIIEWENKYKKVEEYYEELEATQERQQERRDELRRYLKETKKKAMKKMKILEADPESN